MWLSWLQHTRTHMHTYAQTRTPLGIHKTISKLTGPLVYQVYKANRQGTCLTWTMLSEGHWAGEMVQQTSVFASEPNDQV